MKNKGYRGILGVLALLLPVAWGCGGMAARYPADQILTRMESQKRQGEVQGLLAGRALPAAPNPAPLDYKVGPEDLLEVQIYGQDNLNRQVRVSGQGEVTLPLVGPVRVAGLSPQDIERKVAEAYGSNYLRNPQVTVSVKEYRHQRVAVTGAVDKPGNYEMIGPRTLLEMLAMAGGLQDKGPSAKAGDVVHVIRAKTSPGFKQEGAGGSPGGPPSAETMVIDLKRLLAGNAPELNIPVRHGDIIHVPFAGNAYVLGGVRRPGSVAVRDNLTLSQAVALAGGVDPVVATNRVDIMRLDESGKPVTVTTRLDRILNRQEPDIPLKDNDVVVVNVSSFKQALLVFKELLPGGTVSGAYRFAY